MSQECLFCKIIAGEVPSQRIYEDEKTFAFLDIHPVNPGHTLIVPKKHSENLLDTDEQIVAAVMSTTQKVAQAVTTALRYKAFNIGINNGSDAGQVVFHLHVHMMPRHSKDGYTMWAGRKYPEEDDLKQIAEKIRQSMSRQ